MKTNFILDSNDQFLETNNQKIDRKVGGNIIVYQPKLFQKILQLDNIKIENILESLKIENNREKIFKAGQASGGRSGSFFFFSSDGKFIVKTMIKSEVKKLLEILPKYVEYLEKNNNQSLLAKYYGVFKIYNPFFNPVYVLLMQSTASLIKNRQI